MLNIKLPWDKLTKMISYLHMHKRKEAQSCCFSLCVDQLCYEVQFMCYEVQIISTISTVAPMCGQISFTHQA